MTLSTAIGQQGNLATVNRRAVLVFVALTVALVFAGIAAPVDAKPKPRPKTLTVCKVESGSCTFRSVGAAVKAAHARDTIRIKPGTYNEEVVLQGPRYDGVKIVGLGDSRDESNRVLFDGTRSKGWGILAIGVDRLSLSNMAASNYTDTGFFIRGDKDDLGPKKPCVGFTMSDLVAFQNTKYGLYMRNCIGGTMKDSEAYLQGDAGYYVGEVPQQKKPVWITLTNLDAYQNVLGYSGTNSRYVKIQNSRFFNNGAGIVPNTLDSEGFQPAANGKIIDNKIFWNNFNYYNADTPARDCETPAPVCSPIPRTWVSNLGNSPLGGNAKIYYPTGAGVVLLGTDGWLVQGNDIWGNDQWGVGVLADPGNSKAVSNRNRILSNRMGYADLDGATGVDPNGWDLFNQGAGKGNCFAGNGSGVNADGTVTTKLAGVAYGPSTYPSICPNNIGTGDSTGDISQVNYHLLPYVSRDSASNQDPMTQQCDWKISPLQRGIGGSATIPHATIPGYSPYYVTSPVVNGSPYSNSNCSS